MTTIDLSCSLPPGVDLVRHAKIAETLGYHRVWVSDSPALYSDPWAGLALVASNTSRIGLGVSVLVPSTRHVMVNAAAIAGIEALASGRLACAIGTGFTARSMFGQGALSWLTTAQYIADLKALLRGDTIELNGRKTRMSHPDGISVTTPIETPILVAANGPKGIDVARELGDGIMSVQAPIGGFNWSVLLQPGTVLEQGESLSSPRVFESIGPAVASFYHGAYEALGEGVDGFPNGSAWRQMIEQYPEDERHIHLHQEHCYRVNDQDRPLIDVPNMAGMTFTGTAAELRERALQLQAAGVTELLYIPMGHDMEREMRAMRKVID